MAAVDAAGRATGLEPLEAFEDTRARDLYERHSQRVFAYCCSRLGRREDAEDAVQTTFMHAVRGLREGVRPTTEIAWLLGIARNVCLSRLESAGRRGKLELVCDPVDLERNEAPSGRREELIGIEEALARLPEQQRRAVLLRDWRGLSYEEVAEQLGVSLANAESLIFRGRRTLAGLLEETPASTRRRLASLGNAGSLFTWAKASLAGAGAVSKLAAAAAVVLVSGAGVTAGVGARNGGPEPARHVPAGQVATPRPTAPATTARNTVSQGSPAPAARADGAANPVATADRGGAQTPTAPTKAGDTVSQGGVADGALPPVTEAPPRRPPKVGTKPGEAVAAATGAVAATVDTTVDTARKTVQGTVERVVPPLAPVTDAVTKAATDTVTEVVEVVEAVEAAPVPEAPVSTPPVVETVVESVPPVTAGPVTIAPPKLLP